MHLLGINIICDRFCYLLFILRLLFSDKSFIRVKIIKISTRVRIVYLYLGPMILNTFELFLVIIFVISLGSLFPTSISLLLLFLSPILFFSQLFYINPFVEWLYIYNQPRKCKLCPPCIYLMPPFIRCLVSFLYSTVAPTFIQCLYAYNQWRKWNCWEAKRITSIASTRYSDRIAIQAVKIESQITDSHLEISGPSSSSEPSSGRVPPWVHTINEWADGTNPNCKELY